MFNLADVVALSKVALRTYNHRLATYFSENVALNVWADGGEWPQYQKRYDNIFSYIHKMVPRVVNYVSCMSMASVVSHIDFCQQSATICAMNVLHNKSFRISVLQHLVNIANDHKITLIARSTSTAYYLKTLIADYDADAFLNGSTDISLSTSVEILSPAMVLDHYLASGKKKYGTLVLFDADTPTVTFGLFSKMLPYISQFPVYIAVNESNMQEGCSNIASNAADCPIDLVPTVCVGHMDSCESYSSNLLLDIPLSGIVRVCDSQTRIVPVVGPDSRFTLLSRSANNDEKTRIAYWTLANGYLLVKKSSAVTSIYKDDVVLYDRFDYYSSLLWAIEVTTGISPGNPIAARRLWNSINNYSPILLDPISLHMSTNYAENILLFPKQGYIDNDITWKLYYYTNILYTTFTYEQSMTIHKAIIRIGYIFKIDRTIICRIMIQNSADVSIHQRKMKLFPSAVNQYAIIRLGSCYVGLDIRVGQTAHYESSSDSFDNSSSWPIVCDILPAQRFIELRSAITLWNDIIAYSSKPYNWFDINYKFMTTFVGDVY